MDMMAVRRRVLMASRKRLPSAYQEVEYIEGTGTQYIDVNNTNDDRSFDVVVSVSVPLANSSNMLCGMSLYSDASSWCLFWDRSNVVVRRRNSDGRFDASIPLTTVTDKKIRYTLSQEKAAIVDDNGNVLAENTTVTYRPNYFTPVRVFRGSSNSQLYERAVSAKLYSYKVYDNVSGLLEYDLIPCYRKLDGEIGVFDIVGKQFYANSGTGTFLKGADV